MTLGRSLVLIGGLVLSPVVAHGQHMFLDVNGDAAATSADRLEADRETTIAIWVVTDKGLDGKRTSLAAPGEAGPNINSYEVVLHATGGTVEWQNFTNWQTAWTIRVGPEQSDMDYYVGFFGDKHLPPGKYLLGSVTLRAKSGNPTITLAESSPLSRVAETAFGSETPGRDLDNTLKYTSNVVAVREGYTLGQGDWHEVVGVEPATSRIAEAAGLPSAEVARFEVEVRPNPANPNAVLRVRTTRAGRLRVRIFDPSGRLVRTAVDQAEVQSGLYEIDLSPNVRRPLQSGVFFYKVETGEASRSGKFMILK